MFEPFLMLTVLNCFFMFSSTVTTCALWWQYKRHRSSCSSKCGPAERSKLKKSKSENHVVDEDATNLKNGKAGEAADGKLKLKKRDKSSTKLKRKIQDKKDKEKKSKGSQFHSTQEAAIQAEEAVKESPKKSSSAEDLKRGPTSPSSEAKSTIVMEVSTVQKVVQVIDDRDQVLRMPKEHTIYRIMPPEIEKKIECVRENKPADKIRSEQKCNA